ncbi:amidase [Paraburkholderia silviterrae]|uniref:Amidase n=1 Tax=Paraburkholderia silviterrae TaxID=2528715 RepID=A0A4R5M5Q8_9BURK|nr:amidase [Paraburkholderia silviterrae]TDG21303.1 amidase [Paraburkholderia silviterrae]
MNPFSSATAMLAALDRRELSCAELTELHIERIERHDEKLNVVVVRDFGRAREAARAADAARARGERRPLLGIPVTVKESINVAGLRTTSGVSAYAQNVASYDASVVTRLRDAGAIVLGKTNVSWDLTDWQATNPVYGRTANPWDLDRSPGGSSGGSAAVAAGLTPIDLGSDIGGSVRVPGAFCGVFGHKASETALPKSGQRMSPPLPNPPSLMGVMGPITRDAADAALTMDVLGGPEGGEEAAWRFTLPAARREHLKDFRVAVLPQVEWAPVSADIAAARQHAIDALARAGVHVREVQPACFGDLREYFRLYRQLLGAAMGLRLDAAERARRIALFRAADWEFSDAHAHGLEATAAEFFSWHRGRERVRAVWAEFFRDWDIVLAPITLFAPYRQIDVQGPGSGAGFKIAVDDQDVIYQMQLFYPSLATLPGLPATSVPLGLTRGGLPVGLQAIGPYLEDKTTLRFAALCAEALGGVLTPPMFAA